MDFKNIKIIVSEIDGIITNGAKPIDNMGYTMFKYYYENDFEAINELKKFFTFVFLADDSEINYNLMRKRNIPTYFSTNKLSKLDILINKIMYRYHAKPENLLYIGNKITDIPCMQYAEISFTTNKALMKVKYTANMILDVSPGLGVIVNVNDILYAEITSRQRKII